MQNECIRFCLILGNKTQVEAAEFNVINWLPTPKRLNSVCVLIFLTSLLGQYLLMFVKCIIMLSRFTSRSLEKLCLPNQKNTRSYIGPRLWNNLPVIIKTVLNMNAFKHQVKEQVLRI